MIETVLKLSLAARYRQLEINTYLLENDIPVPIHLSIGYEIHVAAVVASMSSVDALYLSHRNLVFHLMRRKKKGSLRDLLTLGCKDQSRWRHQDSFMGFMNNIDTDIGIHYSSSILANQLPVAIGSALYNLKENPKSDGINYVVTGDGALEEGLFWESVVLAASLKTRVLFIIENNNMSMSSTVIQRRVEIDLEAFAKSVGIQYRSIKHGDSIKDMLHSLASARDFSISYSLPAIIEIGCSLFCNHAGKTPGWNSDPKHLRVDDELILQDVSFDPLLIARDNYPYMFKSALDKVRQADYYNE